MKLPISINDSPSRHALVLIAVITIGAALVWLSDIFTPLAMAVALMVMINGIRREIQERTPIPARFAGAVSVFLVVLGFLGSIWIIVDGAAGFFTDASGVSTRIGPRLDQIIIDVSGLVGISDPPTLQDMLAGIDIRGWITTVAFQAQGVVTGAVFVLIYLGFLIASSSNVSRKIVGMFPNSTQRENAQRVIRRMASGVEGYIWIQAVTGVMICAVAWILMRAVGLQNAEFWTFVIFVVGFIPVLGGAIAGLAPPLFALVQFESYWPALILLVGLQVVLFLVGNVVQPRMQGDNQNIDPVVVLLALALFGKMWGIAGMFLSTPLAVMAMALTAEFKSSHWLAVLLSGDGEPYKQDPNVPGGDEDNKKSWFKRLLGIGKAEAKKDAKGD